MNDKKLNKNVENVTKEELTDALHKLYSYFHNNFERYEDKKIYLESAESYGEEVEAEVEIWTILDAVAEEVDVDYEKAVEQIGRGVEYNKYVNVLGQLLDLEIEIKKQVLSEKKYFEEINKTKIKEIDLKVENECNEFLSDVQEKIKGIQKEVNVDVLFDTDFFHNKDYLERLNNADVDKYDLAKGNFESVRNKIDAVKENVFEMSDTFYFKKEMKFTIYGIEREFEKHNKAMVDIKNELMEVNKKKDGGRSR